MTDRVVPPGGEAKIEVKVDTSHKRGNLQKKVTVITDDPDTPEATLTVKAVVEVLFEFEPRRVNFRRVDRGHGAEMVLKPAGKLGGRLRITQVDSDMPGVHAEMEDRAEEGQVLVVRLDKDAPVGRVSGFLVVHTDSEEVPEVKVPVFGLVMGELRVEPSRLSFGFFEDTPPDARSARIRHVDGKPFQVFKVEDDAGYGIVKLIEEPDGAAAPYRVEMTLKPDLPEGKISGNVVITTDVPGEERTLLPYLGFRRPKDAGGVRPKAGGSGEGHDGHGH